MSILNIPTWALAFFIILGLGVIFSWVFSFKGRIFTAIAEEKDEKGGKKE
jgi:hypothetical protein